jgi:hypothetical protein
MYGHAPEQVRYGAIRKFRSWFNAEGSLPLAILFGKPLRLGKEVARSHLHGAVSIRLERHQHYSSGFA